MKGRELGAVQERHANSVNTGQHHKIEAHKAESSWLETQICMLHAPFDYNNRVWWCFAISLASYS